MRTKPCDARVSQGRLAKANQFLLAADTIGELATEAEDVGDAYVTLCVHAGIAAADVVCCVRLGEHAQGENHNEAVGLLKKASPDLAKHLSSLLGLKTKAGYGHTPATSGDIKKAGRAADALLEAARRS